MRAAAEHGLAVVPRGGGTKLHWGAPPRALRPADRHALLDQVRRARGRRPGGAGRRPGVTHRRRWPRTLAAARASSSRSTSPCRRRHGRRHARHRRRPGPRRLRYGTPRDLLIGITVVLADGTVAKSGGKVVKNVAGYDLGKLFTGSLRHARA